MNAARRGYITQGEFAVGGAEDTEISTILGSCVAVCLWDAKSSVGGMNHMLLPMLEGGAGEGFGACEMERLINALIKKGAIRQHMTAKVFGGASMLSGMTDIGFRNSSFVISFLVAEGIPIVAQSVGGQRARQLRFHPGTGQARQRYVAAALPPVVQPEQMKGSDVELF